MTTTLDPIYNKPCFFLPFDRLTITEHVTTAVGTQYVQVATTRRGQQVGSVVVERRALADALVPEDHEIAKTDDIARAKRSAQENADRVERLEAEVTRLRKTEVSLHRALDYARTETRCWRDQHKATAARLAAAENHKTTPAADRPAEPEWSTQAEAMAAVLDRLDGIKDAVEKLRKPEPIKTTIDSAAFKIAASQTPGWWMW